MGPRKTFIWLLCIMLFCGLFLTGCTLKNETLDGQAQRAITALNEGDEDAFVSLLYSDEEFDGHGFYNQLIDIWKPINVDDIKLTSFHVSNILSSGKSVKRYEGVYSIPRNDEYNVLSFVYVESEDGSGITGLYLGKTTSKTVSSSMGDIVLFLACLGIIAITIVDIIRKKPSKYGIYIAVALLFVRFHVNAFAVYIPVGSIAYWCMRKKILASKEQDSVNQ